MNKKLVIVLVLMVFLAGFTVGTLAGEPNYADERTDNYYIEIYDQSPEGTCVIWTKVRYITQDEETGDLHIKGK